MGRISLERIKEIPSSYERVFWLFIEGKAPLKASWERLIANGWEKELDKVATIMYLKANRKPVTPKQFRPLSTSKGKNRLPSFEIRAGRIRIYGFYDPQIGYILYDGHVKKEKEQKRMIGKLGKVIDRYDEEKQEGLF